MTVAAIIGAGEMLPARPWPRAALSADNWRAMAEALRSDPEPALVGLWADTAQVHALFMADAPLLASVSVEAGLLHALSPARPAAALFERMVHDLWGHLAAHGTDSRPLLDQGRWPVLRPLSARPSPNAAVAEPPDSLVAASPDQARIAVGPVGGGADDPVHLRIAATGERVAGLEAQLGYAHRGVLALLRGKPLRAAAQLVARIAGDSTVAHVVAFARAAEAAAEVEPPPRGVALRGLMAELERIASHLADLAGALPGRLAVRCGALREEVLRASQAAFGHRLLMDCVTPGGTAADLAPAGEAAIFAALDRVAEAWPGLCRMLDGAAARTVGIGVTDPALIRHMAPGGVVGRAAGRAADARHTPGYPPYNRPGTVVRTLKSGDVHARLRLRLAEIRDSEALLREWLAAMPPGPVSVAVPAASGEGLGVAEGPHGDIWHWLHLDAGTVAASFHRDPRWLVWPLMEVACRGGALSDVPLILRSFSPAVSGLEL